MSLLEHILRQPDQGRRWRRRYLPGAAAFASLQGIVFSWSGLIGAIGIAGGLAWLTRSGLPVVLVGLAEIAGVAVSNYVMAMRQMKPSLLASDEDREVAKLAFEAELRRAILAGMPPWAASGAANEAAQKGVPVEELQAIANRLTRPPAADPDPEGGTA